MAVNMLVAYCNLGYGSKALQVFRDHVDISHGNISDTIWLTPGVGAFKYMKHLMEQAKRGNVELPKTNLALSQSVADLLALQEFGRDIKIDVILKNIDGTHRMYHANVSDLEAVAPLQHTREEVATIVNSVRV
jgi:hypothetical protein